LSVRDVLQLVAMLGFVVCAGAAGFAIGAAHGWGFLAVAFGFVMLLLAAGDDDAGGEA
jgi:hypothetical protein